VPIPTSEGELTALFARLGASDPELWARSQVEEGIPQLMRYLFLKAAWKDVNRDGDTSWIAPEISDASAHPATPYAGLGLGLEHCAKQGVDPSVLNEMIRCAQARMIFRISYLLDDPNCGDLEELEDVSWGSFKPTTTDALRGHSSKDSMNRFWSLIPRAGKCDLRKRFNALPCRRSLEIMGSSRPRLSVAVGQVRSVMNDRSAATQGKPARSSLKALPVLDTEPGRPARLAQA